MPGQRLFKAILHHRTELVNKNQPRMFGLKIDQKACRSSKSSPRHNDPAVPITDTHSGYFRRRAAILRVVYFDVLVVDFPQQAVQLLFVFPVPVEHQRDDGQHQQQSSCHDRQYFRRVRCKMHQNDHLSKSHTLKNVVLT